MKTEDIRDAAYAQQISEQLANMLEQERVEVSNDVKKFIDTNEFAPELIAHLADENHYSESLPNMGESIDKLVVTLNTLKYKQQIRRRSLRYAISAFASAAVIVFGIIIFSPNIFHSNYEIIAQQQSVLTPTIVLSDGQNIDLTTLTAKIETADYSIEKTADKLSYKSAKSVGKTLSEEVVQYNTIIVPHQYSCNVILEDGTEVVLNAMSELRFPVKFSGDKREVFLKGEGYFNVTKSDKPFIVSASDVKVKVYGTKFNINAYDDTHVETVLVEGSVGVSFADSTNEVRLTPNSICIVNTTSGLSEVENVESSAYTYWLENFFRYDSQPLDQVLKDMSRWYDVDFVFENAKDKEIVITALFQRSDDLEQTLLSISEVTSLEFVKKGGRYVIK